MEYVYGDSNLQSTQHFDAVSCGVGFGKEDAVRITRGEEVVSSTGVPAMPANQTLEPERSR